MFLGPEKVYKDDVTLELEDYMESEFNTVCEDGSYDELGELFCKMWRECCEGNFTMVTDILAKEYVRHEMVSKSQGLSNGDADDDSDNENNVEDAEEMIREALEEVQEDGNAMAQEEEAEAPPLVDPDGWAGTPVGK